MCVRCQLDVAVRLTYCAHRFPFGFSAFHGPHSRLKEDAIHTEHEAAFAVSRYKSACKGTFFCQIDNAF